MYGGWPELTEIGYCGELGHRDTEAQRIDKIDRMIERIIGLGSRFIIERFVL